MSTQLHNSRQFNSICVTCALWLCTAIFDAQQAPQPGQMFDPAGIPDRVKMGALAGNLRGGYQSGAITFVAAKKSVDFYWTASALTNQEPDWDTYGSTASLSTNSRLQSRYTNYRNSVSTNIYVTACGRLDDDELLVAGVSSTGRTMVQRWLFVWPDPMPQPEVDPETGLDSVEVVVPGLQRTNVYTGPPGTSPPKIITGICGLRNGSGATTKALAQFAAPNDVMQLNLGTGAMTLLASETGAGATLGAVSSLGIKHYSSIGIRDHYVDGYLYAFNLGSSASSSFYGGAPVDDDDVRLYLVDTDRNGTIDSAMQMSTIQFSAGDYDELDAYRDWWLE